MEKHQIYESLNRAYFSEDCDEKDVMAQLAPMVSKAKCFVDIGASLGQYTLFANQHMENARIFAIEADPVRFEELERNCAKWAAESSNEITAVHAAVSDQSGEITFFTTNSNVSGGLYQHPVKSTNVQWDEVAVPAVTIDGRFANEGVDFIKMDIEGCELRALKGATQLLEDKETTLFVEVHSWEDPNGQKDQYEVYDYMEKKGYAMRRIQGKVLFQPNT